MQEKEERIKEVEIKVEDKYIRWFSEIGKEDVKEVGGKAANLGEMINIGMPVPPGFVITAETYSYFLDYSKLREKIYELLRQVDVEDTTELEDVAGKIREMIEKAEMPEDLENEISEAYKILSVDKESMKKASEIASSILKMSEPRFVAVRSSATAEDTEKASFAGQQESFLNIKGIEELIEAVKKCFASLFTARSIYYRVKKGFKHEDVLNAVVVQVMIDADKSGVIFSRDPVTKKQEVVIEAVFGLGEGIVSGKIKPDYYIVSWEREIIKKEIANKKIAIVRDSSGQAKEVKLSEDRSKSQVLSSYEIKRLAEYAIELEEHYNVPQDIEFAIDGEGIYIVQTRPVTTLEMEIGKEKFEGKEILSGQAASPGIGSGKVKIVRELKDLSKIEKGDVLVTKMTNPDMVVTMQKSAAIITDEGGMTAHAAIVSREMGIPAIVGTEKATKILREDMLVTVDGFRGKIYEGRIKEGKEEKVEIRPAVQTETKIKVMVDLPSFAERAAQTGLKEVGLLRLEGIIAESSKHPLFFSKQNKLNEYEELIFSGINKIGRCFEKLWIRTSDIRSDEFRNLEGASGKVEANPMLGMHGIRAGLKWPEILKAELSAMKKLAGKGKEVGVLLPQIISVEEVRKVKEILRELNAELKLGVMVETPASVQIIEKLCEEGIDFISFGTNDLTQYTLAVDRGNESVQFLYDEMNPAILSQLSRVIEICKEKGVETSICGQAGSRREMVEFLVKRGIDSISVNADKAAEISKFVKELEEKGVKGQDLKMQKEDEEEVNEKKMEERKKEVEEEKEERKEEGWKEDIKLGFDPFKNQVPAEVEVKASGGDEEEMEEEKAEEKPAKKQVEEVGDLEEIEEKIEERREQVEEEKEEKAEQAEKEEKSIKIEKKDLREEKSKEEALNIF